MLKGIVSVSVYLYIIRILCILHKLYILQIILNFKHRKRKNSESSGIRVTNNKFSIIYYYFVIARVIIESGHLRHNDYVITIIFFSPYSHTGLAHEQRTPTLTLYLYLCILSTDVIVIFIHLI